MAFWRYAFGSSLATAVVTTRNFAVYPNVYSAVAALTKNSVHCIVVFNQVLLIMYLIGKLILKMSFGELRLAEIEKIYQKTWPLLIDGVLMAANLREGDSGYSLAANLCTIGFLLIIHWVLQERALVLYQMMTFPSRLTQLRVFLLTAMLVWVDNMLFRYGWNRVMQGDLSTVVVLSHFIDMLQISVSCAFTLAIDFTEVYIVQGEDEEDEEWEYKEVLVFIVGLSINVLSLAAYAAISYLLGSISFHLLFGIVEISRKIYILTSEFYLAYKAKRVLDQMVCDATTEDIARDNLCVICREEMSVDTSERMKPKRMHCGHVIHFACLKSWLNRAQHCPTCRQPVKEATSAFTQNAPPRVEAAAVEGAIEAAIVEDILAAPEEPFELPTRTRTPEFPFAPPPVPSLPPPRFTAPASPLVWTKFPTRETESGQEVKLGEGWYKFQVS